MRNAECGEAGRSCNLNSAFSVPNSGMVQISVTLFLRVECSVRDTAPHRHGRCTPNIVTSETAIFEPYPHSTLAGTEMFKPNFRFTNKIVRLLTRISAAREMVINSPLIPKWEVALRRESIIHSAHSSTSIEGNKLSLEQVSDLAMGREIMAARKDKQEVLNYLNVLENIGNLTKGNFIVEKDILNIHRMVTRDTLDNPDDCGGLSSPLCRGSK